MENQPTTDDFKAIAKQLSCPEGANGIKTGEAMNLTNKGMTQAAIDAISPQNQDHILEIGHGNAGHLKYLLAKAQEIQYQGADISETMLIEARRINQTFIEQGRAKFTLTDGQSLPFKNETFHKVFTVNTIYFWKDAPAYLTEIKRVIKQNGLFALCFADKAFMEKLPFTPYGFKLYHLDNVKDLLETAGFTIFDELANTEQVKSNAGEMVTRDYFVVVAKN